MSGAGRELHIGADRPRTSGSRGREPRQEGEEGSQTKTVDGEYDEAAGLRKQVPLALEVLNSMPRQSCKPCFTSTKCGILFLKKKSPKTCRVGFMTLGSLEGIILGSHRQAHLSLQPRPPQSLLRRGGQDPQASQQTSHVLVTHTPPHHHKMLRARRVGICQSAAEQHHHRKKHLAPLPHGQVDSSQSSHPQPTERPTVNTVAMPTRLSKTRKL